MIARSADEEFRLSASTQKFEIVDAAFDRDGGKAEGDERAHAVVRISRARSDGGAKGKTGEDDGQREFVFEPVEGGAHVFDFANAVCVLAFTQAGTAEVEAEHGKSEAIERFHGVEDDFVVERSTEERMRMADHGGMRRAGRTGVEERFQSSGGAGEEQGADAGGFGRHGIRVQQCARGATGVLARPSITGGRAGRPALPSIPHYPRIATGCYAFSAWTCLRLPAV